MFARNLIAITVSSMLVTSCLGFEPFQPNPPEFQEWSKPGATELEVKRAMLECGYPSPFGSRDRHVQDVSATPNEIAVMSRCMKREGFVFDNGRYDFCTQWRELAACGPDVRAPPRSVEKRLDGDFCRKYAQADVCKP